MVWPPSDFKRVFNYKDTLISMSGQIWYQWSSELRKSRALNFVLFTETYLGCLGNVGGLRSPY